jgi:hypothetical protein
MMRVRGLSLIGLLVAASALLAAIVVAAHAFRAGRKWNGASGSPTRDLRL